METLEQRPTLVRTPAAWSAVALWTAVVSGFVLIGADLMWIVSVGDAAREMGRIPTEVPNLVAPQVEWRSPDALAQLFLSLVHSWGWAALPALNVLIVFLTLVVLVVDGRRSGGSDVRLAVAVTLVVVGAASTFVVVRFPMLSLVPFVVLVLLLREWDRGQIRAIWWVPPLMVVWGNLHGALLVGLSVLGVFVLFAGRKGIRARALAGGASLLSLVLTSAGLSTPHYYVTALSNEAAQRGTDLWARPDLTNPFDIVLVASAALLLAMAARGLRRWEWFVVAGLAVGTVLAARNGVWLLLFLAPVAAVRTPRSVAVPDSLRPLNRRVIAAATVYCLGLGAVVGIQLARREGDVQPPGTELVPVVRDLASDGVVIAVEPEAETFAQAGVQVWIANPIDAFDPQDQREFLDFLQDCEVPDVPVDVVVVEESCVAPVVGQGWSETERGGGLVMLTPAGTAP
jgi:hypothetical protein